MLKRFITLLLLKIYVTVPLFGNQRNIVTLKIVLFHDQGSI